MKHRGGETNSAPAAQRRHLKARHGSAGKAKVEQTESALADATFHTSLRPSWSPGFWTDGMSPVTIFALTGALQNG